MSSKLHIVAITALIKNPQKDKFLVVKRAAHEIAFPGKWAFPGGKSERGQTILDTLKREVLEEVGLEIEDNKKFLKDFTFVRPDGMNVVGVCFEVTAKPGTITLAKDFDEYRWITPEELDTLDYIKGMEEEVKLAFLNKKRRVGAGFGVMMIRDGKVLLGKRHEDPEKADTEFHEEGTWTFPGGKLEYGESFEDGAKREVLEETGITLHDVKVIAVNNDKNEHAHFVTIGLFSDNFSGDAQVLEPDEITEWRWFDLHDLPNPLYFPSAKLIENYKQEKLYIAK